MQGVLTMTQRGPGVGGSGGDGWGMGEFDALDPVPSRRQAHDLTLKMYRWRHRI